MIISINDPHVIPIAVREFRKGSIVIFPTDTSYGLGTIGLGWNDGNIKRIYEIKSRPMNNPLSLLVTEPMLSKYVEISSQYRDILKRVWPGSFTAVLSCNPYALQTLSPFLNLNNQEKIAFRVPKHGLLLEIIEKVDSPVIGTSANKTGSKSKYDLQSIFQELSLKDIHLWIDAGRLPENPPSTVVDLTDPLKPILLRRGNVECDKIFNIDV